MRSWLPHMLRAAGLLLTIPAVAQAPMGSVPIPVVSGAPEEIPQTPPQTLSDQTPLFRDLDLLRKNEFAHASAAMLSVRVQDKHGNFVAGLVSPNFEVRVNGTIRKARLQQQNAAVASTHLPLVLLVFPPNQPTIHYIAVRDAIDYFRKQPDESMGWKVGLFDSNGTFFPFTSERHALLGNLESVRAAREPFQFMGYGFLGRGDSTWLQKAETAISNMERGDGPRLIIAMNPLTFESYDLNSSQMALGGPAQLEAVANSVGAHIYVDNAGGPEPIVPGGSADAIAPIWGSIPSSNMRISPQFTAALNYAAFTNSLMMQTARETLGGFANSLKDLTAKMQRDLDQAYMLEFDMTPEDQDKGIPEVEVSSGRRDLRLAPIDLGPLRPSAISLAEPVSQSASRATATALLKSTGKPMLSPDFRISQRVDYFPVRAGLAPVLPMSCIVEWTGQGRRPEEISVAESVTDLDISSPVIEREIDSSWQARSVRWERDGSLHPGHYLWFVAVHDKSGKVLSSSRESFLVEYPQGASIAVSSLTTGAACSSQPRASALIHRPQHGEKDAPQNAAFDPLQLEDCRLIPQPSNTFSASDTLRALIRIYPIGKLSKNRSEAWSAHFTLRSENGSTEATNDSPFSIDSGTGLSAVTALRLDDSGIHPGPHVLTVEVRGPGIRKSLKASQAVTVAPGLARQ